MQAHGMGSTEVLLFSGGERQKEGRCTRNPAQWAICRSHLDEGAYAWLEVTAKLALGPKKAAFRAVYGLLKPPALLDAAEGKERRTRKGQKERKEAEQGERREGRKNRVARGAQQKAYQCTEVRRPGTSWRPGPDCLARGRRNTRFPAPRTPLTLVRLRTSETRPRRDTPLAVYRTCITYSRRMQPRRNPLWLGQVLAGLPGASSGRRSP